MIVYRAFYELGVFGWPDHACRGCSLGADQVSHLAHLNVRDTSLAYISRAPQTDIAALKERMDWDMPWYTITDSFDADFGVNEWHGHNVFIHEDDRIFRTYFITTAPTKRWEHCGVISTSPRSDVKRRGKTLRRAIPKIRHTSGGTGTTITRRKPTRQTPGGSIFRMPAWPPSPTLRRGRERIADHGAQQRGET